MKYVNCNVLVGFKNEEIFDCECDLTFELIRRFHNDEDQWLIDHEDRHTVFTLTETEALKLKYKTVTPEGGI